MIAIKKLKVLFDFITFAVTVKLGFYIDNILIFKGSDTINKNSHHCGVSYGN
jgi:hypothetical protein